MSWQDLVLLAAIVLLVCFGHKLAEFGRRLGKGIRRNGGPGKPTAA